MAIEYNVSETWKQTWHENLKYTGGHKSRHILLKTLYKKRFLIFQKLSLVCLISASARHKGRKFTTIAKNQWFLRWPLPLMEWYLLNHWDQWFFSQPTIGDDVFHDDAMVTIHRSSLANTLYTPQAPQGCVSHTSLLINDERMSDANDCTSDQANCTFFCTNTYPPNLCPGLLLAAPPWLDQRLPHAIFNGAQIWDGKSVFF